MNITENQIKDESLLNGVPYQSDHESMRKSRRWKWPVTAMLALVIALVLPSRAQAGIFDIFGELFGTIQNDMGAALSQINALTQEMQQLHQQIVWPLALVNQARLSRFHDAGLHAEIAQCDAGKPAATGGDSAQPAVGTDSRASGELRSKLRDCASGEHSLSAGQGDDGHR
jgi:hypothetical protein